MLWQNLIADAIEFAAPTVQPRVSVDAELDTESGMWQLALRDSGIAPEFAEQVFAIFRLHSRHEYGGTGIRSAVCMKIVEYHGGRIWIDTCVMCGSKV